MKNLLVALILLAVASCLVSVDAKAAPTNETEDYVSFDGKDWKELKSLLYNIFEPPKTKAGIDRLLQKLYIELEGVNEAESIGFRQGVKLLLEIGQPTGPICGAMHFRRLRTFIEKYQTYITKVGKYLYECEREQFERCKPFFDNELVQNLRKISRSDLDNATSLVHHVDFPLKALELKAPTQAEADRLKRDVLKGVLNFMEEVDSLFVRPTMLKVKPEQREEFGKQLERNVIGLCNRFTADIGLSLSVYDFISGVRIIDNLDKSTKHWLKAWRICRYIKDLGPIGIDDFRSSSFRLN